jgi:hypothetical protein
MSNALSMTKKTAAVNVLVLKLKTMSSVTPYIEESCCERHEKQIDLHSVSSLSQHDFGLVSEQFSRMICSS